MLSAKQHKDRALVTALALDLLSRNLRRAPSASASVEQNEYARRDRDLAWYLLRGSAWESYTRFAVFFLDSHDLISLSNQDRSSNH